MSVDAASVHRHSPSAAKIALFRSLFRGREDVYPRRFESRRTGKSGYAPACANEWVRGICEKLRIKCAVCPHRRFLPATDDVIRWHLSGRDGEDQPWTATPSRSRKEPEILADLPQSLELVLGNQIYIAKEGLHPGLRNRLLRLAAFQNPEFYKAQAMRVSTYGKPRIIDCAEDHLRHIGLPRGCLEDVCQMLSDAGIRPLIRDERYGGRQLAVTFQGSLRAEQQTAAEAMRAHDTGVLAATTAFGKTVVAAWLIAQRGVNTLILVHRRQLLDQWVERLSAFLGLPAKAIGRIGGGRSRATGLIDVAIIQSLVRKGVIDDRVADYGHVIVDECHHLSAHSFEAVARQAKARFIVGLSATVGRKDGHHPIIVMQCGPIRYRVNARAQAAARPFEHFVFVQPTAFQSARPPDRDKRVELCYERA